MDQVRSSTERDEADDPESSKPHILLMVILGFVLPYLAIVLGWSLAPDSVREGGPEGDSASTTVCRIIVAATLLGFVPGTLWLFSRPRPATWWFATVLVVVMQAIGVFIFNLWFYIEAGGAFP